MSNPVVTVQVSTRTVAPRGAELLGGLAAAVCILASSLAHAVSRIGAVRPEQRHA